MLPSVSVECVCKPHFFQALQKAVWVSGHIIQSFQAWLAIFGVLRLCFERAWFHSMSSFSCELGALLDVLNLTTRISRCFQKFWVSLLKYVTILSNKRWSVDSLVILYWMWLVLYHDLQCSICSDYNQCFQLGLGLGFFKHLPRTGAVSVAMLLGNLCCYYIKNSRSY